jgi:tetratricopeptide (TPR) repeat protein
VLILKPFIIKSLIVFYSVQEYPSNHVNQLNQQRTKEYINTVISQAQLLIQKNPQGAITLYEEAERLLKHQIPNDLVLAGLLNDKGMSIFLLGDYPKSIKTLKESLKIKVKIGNGRLIATTLLNLSVSYRANCQYEESIKTLNNVKTWANNNHEEDLLKQVESELVNTINARDKIPLAQLANVRITDTQGFSHGIADIEYLPSAFKDVFAKVDEITIKFSVLQEVCINITFRIIGKINNLYENEVWRKHRSELLYSKMKNPSPNLVAFCGKNIEVPQKDIKLYDEKMNAVLNESEVQFWQIFTPDSYPFGGFSSPMPVCESFKFFSGLARIIYWELTDTTYHFEIKFRTSCEGAFEFGLLLPFKKLQIDISSLTVTVEKGVSIKKGYLKRISYNESRNPEIAVQDAFNFSNYKNIHAFTVGKIAKLESSTPTQMLLIEDFEVLGFEFLPVQQGSNKSKYDIFPFLKDDIIFRKEIGQETYEKIVEEARKLPEKCGQHPTGEQCRNCSTKMLKPCIINVIGIICGSSILPHHGFEYADLLVKSSAGNESLSTSIPLIVKGPNNLTYKNDGGLLRQILEKVQDHKVETIVIVHSGQMDNRLKMQLEREADIHEKSLVYINERDLAQFLRIYKDIKK